MQFIEKSFTFCGLGTRRKTVTARNCMGLLLLPVPNPPASSTSEHPFSTVNTQKKRGNSITKSQGQISSSEDNLYWSQRKGMGALSFAYDTICSTDSYKSRLSIWHWDSYVFTQLLNIWEPFPVMDPQYSYKNLLISVITWKYYLNVSIECNLSKSDLIYSRNSYFTACGLHFFLFRRY